LWTMKKNQLGKNTIKGEMKILNKIKEDYKKSSSFLLTLHKVLMKS